MKLLIDDEKIGEMADSSSDNKECPASFECLLIVTAVKAGAQAELDHLAGLGIIYVKEEIICKESNKSGKCWIDGEDIEKVCGNDGTCVYREYIPLSDYMKGEKKE